MNSNDANAIHRDLAVRIQRIARLHRRADDNGAEAVHFAELLLPCHHGLEFAPAAQIQAVDDVFCDHNEEGEIDRVNAFTQNGSLTTALPEGCIVVGAPLTQESPRVLEIVARYDAAQCLAGW